MVNDELIFEDLNPDTNHFLRKYFISPFIDGFVKCNGCLAPESSKEFYPRVREMNVRDDDIWVCSFPKTGTTWTQEMVWCIINDLNFEAAKEDLGKRFPHTPPIFNFNKLLEKHPEIKFPEHILKSFDYIENLPSPRFIKTHLPFNLLPRQLQNRECNAKIIYTIRNPRDTCVSFFHHSKLLLGYRGSFQQFAELFLEGLVRFGPFDSHVNGYWQQRDNPNILFLNYEEMKKDLKSVIYKTAKFIGKTLSEDDVEKLADHLSFSNMKNNPAVNYQSLIEFSKKYNFTEEDGNFIRQGKVGGWEVMMDSQLREKFEKWEKENLKDISFVY